MLEFFQLLIPEIFLFISIIFLIIFRIFECKFGNFFSSFFLIFIYCLISLLFTLLLIFYLYSMNLYSISIFDKFFILNFNTFLIKIVILIISICCLYLFRYCLTISGCDCLEYFVIYLIIILISLIFCMINSNYLWFFYLFLEILIFFLNLLASFHYDKFGFLIFDLILKKKIIFRSSLLGFLGICLINVHTYLFDLFLIKNFIHHNLLFFLLNSSFLLNIGVFLFFVSILLKMVIFYTPIEYNRYCKTPVLSIIFINLIPKIVIFYGIIKLLNTNYYYFIIKEDFRIVLLITALLCLIISIGMRRLFLKHFIEYLSLVNTGYLFLCLIPLSSLSFYYGFYLLFFHILIIFFYGSILLIYDLTSTERYRPSFDQIFYTIEFKDYFTDIFCSIFFLFFGLVPTRKDYPCHRGIPFNGFFLQYLLLYNLLCHRFYLIFFFFAFF